MQFLNVHDKQKYKIRRKIGSGSTSTVYEAITNDDRIVAIKQVAINENGMKHNYIEKQIYLQLNEFAKQASSNKISCSMFDCFSNENFEYFVLEKLGVSLQHLLFVRESSKFDLNTVCTIFDSMIVNLYKLHQIGFVHNDIKLENILIGTNYDYENDHNIKYKNRLEKLYLIDFGISDQYYDFKQKTHNPIKNNISFQGTNRFSSVNHHCHRVSQSRRDDLESLIYLCIYCLTNDLPWIVKYDKYKQSLDEKKLPTKQDMYEQSKEIKLKTSIDGICRNVPSEFNVALTYVRNLKYNEMPDYRYLQHSFQNLHSKIMAIYVDWGVYQFNNNYCHFLGCHTIATPAAVRGDPKMMRVVFKFVKNQFIP